MLVRAWPISGSTPNPWKDAPRMTDLDPVELAIDSLSTQMAHDDARIVAALERIASAMEDWRSDGVASEESATSNGSEYGLDNEPKTERNAAICADRAAGVGRGTLAKQHGITPQRSADRTRVAADLREWLATSQREARRHRARRALRAEPAVEV